MKIIPRLILTWYYFHILTQWAPALSPWWVKLSGIRQSKIIKYLGVANCSESLFIFAILDRTCFWCTLNYWRTIFAHIKGKFEHCFFYVLIVINRNRLKKCHALMYFLIKVISSMYASHRRTMNCTTKYKLELTLQKQNVFLDKTLGTVCMRSS
jgi:hypothetical protein